MSDDVDIAGLRQGDRAAYTAVYQRYAAPLFSFLLRLSRRRALAEELSQNVWLKLARQAPNLAPDTHLRAWLYTVAHNEYRSYRRWIVVDTERLRSLRFAVSEPTPSLEAHTDARATLSRVASALGLLPVADREILLLCAESGLDDAALAETLRLSHASFRQRKSRARRRLQALLEGEQS